jgi:hypothetical protein
LWQDGDVSSSGASKPAINTTMPSKWQQFLSEGQIVGYIGEKPRVDKTFLDSSIFEYF